MVTHGIKIVLPVPTGTAKVAEALEFTAEIRSLLNCTQTANGILQVGVHLNLKMSNNMIHSIVFKVYDERFQCSLDSKSFLKDILHYRSQYKTWNRGQLHLQNKLYLITINLKPSLFEHVSLVTNLSCYNLSLSSLLY